MKTEKIIEKMNKLESEFNAITQAMKRMESNYKDMSANRYKLQGKYEALAELLPEDHPKRKEVFKEDQKVNKPKQKDEDK